MVRRNICEANELVLVSVSIAIGLPSTVLFMIVLPSEASSTDIMFEAEFVIYNRLV